MRESRTYGSVRGALSNRNCRGEAADMVARPYAIHSDSECGRLEKQAVLAGLENHLRHVPVPKTAQILDAGCGSGAMARCFASHFADASVIGVDIRDDYSGPQPLRALLATKTKTPIVFANPHVDPIGDGFIQSLARPGGNITGLSMSGTDLESKRLEVLKNAVPTIDKVMILHDPSMGSTARPRVLAVCKLTAGSNLIGCSTGRSSGFRPPESWPRNLRRGDTYRESLDRMIATHVSALRTLEGMQFVSGALRLYSEKSHLVPHLVQCGVVQSNPNAIACSDLCD